MRPGLGLTGCVCVLFWQLTPYLGATLQGVVRATVVRGQLVFRDGLFSPEPLGKHLLITPRRNQAQLWCSNTINQAISPLGCWGIKRLWENMRCVLCFIPKRGLFLSFNSHLYKNSQQVCMFLGFDGKSEMVFLSLFYWPVAEFWLKIFFFKSWWCIFLLKTVRIQQNTHLSDICNFPP